MPITKNTKQHKTLAQKGFTLIEMAIVIAIIGMVIASAGTAYVQWQQWLRHDITKNNIQTARAAIEGFLNTNGRYPCPASLEATRADGEFYGLEPRRVGTTCDEVINANINIAATGPNPDIFVAPAITRNPAFIRNDGAAGTPADRVVRIGAVPFRSLGLDESQAYDGYRNRLYYAVTSHQTSRLGFDTGTTGLIDLVDATGNSQLDNAGSAHYIVFSAGENEAGAFTIEGTQNACIGGTNESGNCDLADGTFVIEDYGNNGSDDLLSFGIVEIPHFERPPNAGTPGGGELDDGITKADSDLGIGSSGDNPQEELDVAGVIRIQDDPLIGGIEGRLEADALCPSGSSSNCFEIEAIAGKLVDGEGMQCPSGQFITGIQNNTPICSVVETVCPGANEIMVGINADGTARCTGVVVGKASCPTDTVTFCSETKTLASGVHGTNRDISVGTSRKLTFKCVNGAWKKTKDNATKTDDRCSCIQTPVTTGNLRNCKKNLSCGNVLSGKKETFDFQAKRCPDGKTNNVTNVNQDNCDCNATLTPRTRNGSCTSGGWIKRLPSADKPPSGFRYSGGRIYVKDEIQCPSKTCTGEQFDRHTCECKDGTPKDVKKNCQNGYSADPAASPPYAYQREQFVCNGTGGKWGQTIKQTINYDACTVCDETPKITIKDCDDASKGWTPIVPGGGIRLQTTFKDTGTGCIKQPVVELDELEDVCKPPPPVSCAWSRGGTTSTGTHNTNKHGGKCDCGDPISPCSQGNTLYKPVFM